MSQSRNIELSLWTICRGTHGIINRVLEVMVVDKFGNDFWKRLKNAAGIKLSGEFLATEFYPDESTYKLVEAANSLAEISSTDFLEIYGEYFYDYVEEYGHVTLLKVLGRTPEEFLECLDTMHLCLARVYPAMKPPLFRCQKRANGDLTLFYYSKRPNLVPMIVGLIRRAMQRIFDITAIVTVVSQDPLKGCYEVLIQILNKTEAEGFCSVDESMRLLVESQLLSPWSFTKLLPFHFIVNRQMSVKQCGLAILQKVPNILDGSLKLDQVAKISRPAISLTFEAILEHLNSVFLVEIVFREGPGNYFQMNGQMVYLEEPDCILYIGSPYVVNLEDLFQKGFCISDIALHDAKRDFIIASEEFEIERVLFKKLEEMTINLQESSKLLAMEKMKTDKLLYEILPIPVARELRMGNIIAPQRYGSVTILFSGIVNFDKFCLSKGDAGAGIEIVDLLNKVYGQIDKLLESTLYPDLYKIETVNDTYVVVSGAPEPALQHAKSIANLALPMVQSVQSIGFSPFIIQLTIGINSGEVVAGVIGHRTPRYCLFGDSMNLASRTMHNGTPGQINITQSTFILLHADPNCSNEFTFERSGDVIMKNITGPVKIWTVKRKPTKEPRTKTRSGPRSSL